MMTQCTQAVCAKTCNLPQKNVSIKSYPARELAQGFNRANISFVE